MRGKAHRSLQYGNREAFKDTEHDVDQKLVLRHLRALPRGVDQCGAYQACKKLQQGHLAARRGSTPKALRPIATSSRGGITRKESKGWACR